MSICVILGGAISVWRELHEAERLIGGRPYIVGAVNDSGAVYPGRLDFWATLHPGKMPVWRAARRGLVGDDGGRGYSHIGGIGDGVHEIVPRWGGPSGSSGLYAVQIAMERRGATRVILCGVPMDGRPNVHRVEAEWRQAEGYRAAWVRAADRDEFRAAVRSMSGWTAALLGQPSDEWLGDGA